MTPNHEDSLHWAHPLVRDWFIAKFGTPTAPQIQGWPAILTGKSTLISAPTGSGKTLAAFLTCINHLVSASLSQKLPDETQVVYVSPLKALSNDIYKNLMFPLTEIKQLALERGLQLGDIRVAVRTSDTLAKERQAMLKKPPHILVTTPESLYILLTAEKSRAMLTNVKTVIVDEIHALANDKRGSYLALSLERLHALTKHTPVRIGLSATQKPIETIAHFLTGNHRMPPVIINIGHTRKLELAIEVPSSELGPIASNELWDEIYERVAMLANQNRSTLVFVNTRRLAERIAHHLAAILGEDKVAAHHGSLSRKLRLAVETKLKQGELKVLVATASLELGIDIGTVDLVCQIGSPRAISIALQRIGRAGHSRGAISKGRLLVTTLDELLECASLVKAILAGDLDTLIMPFEPIDILAQQIVAICATGEWREDDLFALIKKAYPYAHLSRDTFNRIITMLSEGISGSRGRYGSYLLRDQVNSIVKARRGARLAAIMNGGAIPENGLFSVIAEPQETLVGTLDEDFAVESNRGDIILLGSTSWQIKRVENIRGQVRVEDAHGAPPSVPFWRGEAPARTDALSQHVSELKKTISERLPFQESLDAARTQVAYLETVHWLIKHCGLDNTGAEQLIDYILKGRALLGAVPTQQTIIAERFFDEAGGMQLIIHAPFGARINKAWGLALRKKFCRAFNFELQAQATDNGLNIALAEQHSFPLADVFYFLHPNTIKDVLVQAVLQSPLFTTRWRWTATRALALKRFFLGKKVPPNIQRMLSDDLLASVFPDAQACQDNLGGREIVPPDHPLIHETMKEVLTNALDVAGLEAILSHIQSGKISCLAIDTPYPSTFSHEILNANPYAYLDDAPLEERRARAVAMRRILPSAQLETIGKLDLTVIHEVREAIWPDIRDADELHDMLQTVIAFPADNTFHDQQKLLTSWQDYFEQLLKAGRSGIAIYKNKHFWFAVEKAKSFSAIYPEAQFQSEFQSIEQSSPKQDDALVSMLKGWMYYLGPVTCQKLSDSLAISPQAIEQTLLKLEATGLILRGQFTQAKEETEWCERRLLARIHRRTLGKLRKEIEPIHSAQFMQWLLKWQHVAPGTQLSGEQGLLEILRQLQGFEIPANAWEPCVIAKRLLHYDKEILDHLCLKGIVGWGRLSSAARKGDRYKNANDVPVSKKKRILPTSIAPITFFVRGEADWMSVHPGEIHDLDLMGLSHTAKDVYHFLQQKGASFFTDIVRCVGKLTAEIETGLWELVVAGLVTADAFDNLRGIIDKRRRLNKGRRKALRFYNTGRWYLLPIEAQVDHPVQVEAACWMLLKRYGVVFRDLLAREKNIPRWRDLLLAFRRLEDKGEVRGGRFVSGFLGEQFALPYAVDSLRAMRNEDNASDKIIISTADPLNLAGIILPGARIASISGKTYMTIEKNGVCALSEFNIYGSHLD